MTRTAPDGPVVPHYPAPRYRRPFGLGRETWLQYLFLGVLAVLVLAPVVPTLYQSIIDRPLYEAGGAFTLDNYVRLFTDAGFGAVVVNTVLFAGLTTAVTLLLAVPMAIVVVRTDLPGRAFFSAAMQWPFFISSLILGFGWIAMYGPAGFVSVAVRQVLGVVPWNLYSIPGMALTEAVALAPVVYVFCVNALRRSDATLENAAQLCGAGPFRVLRSVVVPMLRPPIVYSAVLVVSMSVETLSVPLLYGQPVGINVFSTFLYRNGLQSVNPDHGVLGAASALILVVTIGLVTAQVLALKNAQRFVSVRGKATVLRRLDIGWLRWVAVVAISLYILLGALIPIGGLVFRSFTFVFSPLRSPFDSLTADNYERIFNTAPYVRSITNSLVVAAVGALVVSVVALAAVLVARRSSFRFARLVEYLTLAPQAMPGIIVGVGLFWGLAFLPFGVGGVLQGTLWVIVIAFGLRALPSAFGSISPAVMQIGQELDSASRVAGADWLRTCVRVTGRLVLPAFTGSFVLVFVIMLKEYSPAVFLDTADTKVIGGTMLELWTQGNTGSVAALATLQIAMTAVFVGVAGRFAKGRDHA